MITIFHNPHCSKSREALLLSQHFASTSNLTLNVVDYQASPLSLKQISELHQQLNCPVRNMVRDNELLFSTLNLGEATDAMLLTALADQPQLLQRPIVVYRGQAVICRPMENLINLFQI